MEVIRLHYYGDYFVDVAPSGDGQTYKDSHGNVINVFQWALSYPQPRPIVYVSQGSNDALDVTGNAQLRSYNYAVCVTP